jgi:hypothetical protein
VLVGAFNAQHVPRQTGSPCQHQAPPAQYDEGHQRSQQPQYYLRSRCDDWRQVKRPGRYDGMGGNMQCLTGTCHCNAHL